MRRSGALPLYVGGFLGPCGGGVLAVLLPQLRAAFDVSTGAIAAAIPAYLVPFAVATTTRRRPVRAGGGIAKGRAERRDPDWRLAFAVPAVVAVVLALFPPADAQRAVGAAPARLRAVLVPRVGVLCATAFAGFAGVTGLGFLVALRAADGFGLGSADRGLLLAGFGVVGIVAGRPSGELADRLGRVPVSVVGSAASAAFVLALGFAGTAVALGALWVLAGLGSTLVWAGLNTLTVEAVPENRAGATSVISAFKFAGNAAAPVIWLPLYHADVRLAFGGAAVAAALVGALTLLLRDG